MNSVLRWAGSKRKLLPRIASYWDGTPKRYLEPFAGSAALFFHLKPKRSVLNDNNAELIHAYKQLKARPDEIFRLISSYPQTADFYYKVRDWEPNSLTPMERAARLFYLNRYCFNGIYRVNLKGHFNVPFSHSRTGAMPPLSSWRAAAALLKNASLKSSDFEEFVSKNVAKGDFVYLDPPYAVSNRRIFRQYSLGSFGVSDMSRLSACLNRIDSVGARFIVSYAVSPESRSLTKGWHVRQARVQRNVAGFNEHRRTAREVLISNFVPAEG